MKPSEVLEANDLLIGSPMRKGEYETIMCNILNLMIFEKGDRFCEFAEDEYTQFREKTNNPQSNCINGRELDLLNELIRAGFLNKRGENIRLSESIKAWMETQLPSNAI